MVTCSDEREHAREIANPLRVNVRSRFAGGRVKEHIVTQLISALPELGLVFTAVYASYVVTSRCGRLAAVLSELEKQLPANLAAIKHEIAGLNERMSTLDTDTQRAETRLRTLEASLP